MQPDVEIHVLAADDRATMRGMLRLFGEAFEDLPTYLDRQPDDAYLGRLLASPDFIAIAAVHAGRVVGGLAAYVLHKFEQARSEVYLYDLAVDAGCRRQGIATALIEAVCREGRARGAWVVFVQADEGDDAAIALYSRLGVRERVLHFDLCTADGPA